MTTIAITPALVFDLSPLMTSEDALKEMHAKAAGSTLVNKTTLQTIIVVVMSYERICSTDRAVAASAGVTYVSHTLIQYQVLIDRVAHTVYLAAVLVGPAPAYPDPFDEHLAETVDDLQYSFDAFVVDKRYNNIYSTGDTVTIAVVNVAQEGRIDRGLQNLMKDCNHQLTSALCASFSRPVMAAYQHLVNLDFVRSVVDVNYPHIQFLPTHSDEYFKTGRLLESSRDNHFALFNSPDLFCIDTQN